jgi:hypothetical protein
MLTAGVLSFDPEGRIILSADPPLNFNGGTPIAADGGLAAAGGALPDLLLAAIGYLADGTLTDSDNPLVPQGGLLTNRDGQIRISTGLPTLWYAGLPLTAEGFLAVSPGIVPPVDLGAYDSSFDNAFDIVEGP